MGMTYEQLGAQYRTARESIVEHRRRQAAAESALSGLLAVNRGLPDTPEIVEAREAVGRAVADVEWCKAATIAAGEAFKGVKFGPDLYDTARVAATRARALNALTGED